VHASSPPDLVKIDVVDALAGLDVEFAPQPEGAVFTVFRATRARA